MELGKLSAQSMYHINPQSMYHHELLQQKKRVGKRLSGSSQPER